MKRITALFITVTTVILLAVFTVSPSAAWDGITIDTAWYNTTDTTFTLTTPEQLAGLAAIVNGAATGITPDDFTGKTIMLGADIDLGGKNWTPIGITTGASGTTGFMGILDGQGHYLKNLTIDIATREPNGIRYGLFGVIGGTAKNINFVGASIVTKDACYSGVVAGYIGGGTVARCTIDASSSVECYSSANGMIAGRVEKSGTIDSCINEGTIYGYGSIEGPNAKPTNNVIIGGIVGLADSSVVKNCVNYGNVIALAKTATPNHAGASGISGFVKAAEIVNCVNYGEISFTDYFNGNTGTGSIVGKFHSSAGSVISNCYNFGSVTGRDNDTTQTGLIGGLLQVLGTIENCYSVPSGNLEIAGSNMISGFELKDNKIVAKTDAEYAAMESAAAAIEDSVFEITIPLKIHYVYSNGDKAAEDYIADLREGEDYNVEPPAITGYAPDKEVITGKMGNTPLEITVTYSLRNFTLTIEYVFEDGSKAAESYVDTKPYGTEFSVESPVLEGYEANFPLVEGKYEVDRTIKVKYTSTGDVTETSEGAETTTPPETEKPKTSGCKSAVGSAFVLLALVGTAVVAKKRRS